MKRIYHFLMILFIICFTTNLYSQSVPSYVPTNGLVGWWPLDGNANDISGNNYNGLNSGAVSSINRFGVPNSCLNFDQDFVEILGIPFNLQNDFSFSYWQKLNAYDDAKVILDINQNTICNGTPHIWQHLNSIRLGMCGTSVNSASMGDQSSLINLWINYTLTHQGGISKMYKNGSLIFSITNMWPTTSLMQFTLANGGNTSSLLHGQPSNIHLDDVGMWNRALTQQEITNLYNFQQTSLCLPTITTNTPISIGIDSVVIVGDILNDGGSSIVLRGVCYSTTPSPNMGNPRTEEGSGIGSFTSTLRNLSPSTAYYARSYAKNSQGVVVYGNEVSFSTGTPIPGIRCPGTPTVTDIDGNIYHTVQIGTQCWTQSNLKVSKYRNGDNIPTGLSNNAWQNTMDGAYAIYNNNPVNDVLYGKLYNHYAVMDTRGVCPTGWHVPTNGEWNLLVKYLDSNADTTASSVWPSSVAGGSLKSTATQPTPGGWSSPNADATNSSGFTALPSGQLDGNGFFHTSGYSIGNAGGYWSSILGSNSYVRYLFYTTGYLLNIDVGRGTGLSIRCLKDVIPSVSTTTVSNVTATSATTGGNVTHDGGAPVTARGVAYGTSATPTTSGTITTDGTGTGVFTSTLTGLTPSTTYYVRAYATNSVGTAYGNEVTFTTQDIPTFTCGTSTVSDVDGNSYNTVQIGTQCWTQSNLKVSKYRNGDSIPNVYNDLNWASLTYGAYCVLENNQIYNGVYGKLYNHFAVMDVRGICPTGWHVPSDFEWKILIRHLDASADTLCNVPYGHGCVPSTIAGGMLRNVAVSGNLGVSGWGHPNAGATNSSGFNALPGGWRHNTNGAFIGTTDMAYWWSYKLINAPSILLMSNTASIYLSQNEDYVLKTNGNYVRCLKD